MKYILPIALLAFIQWQGNAQSCLPGGITFVTQADVDNFPINHPTCKVIEGNVYALSSSIQNLNGLSQIEHIGGDLLISGNEQLANLNGLAKLKTIGLACRIQNNPLLTNLDSLRRLSAVKGDFFYIGNNIALASIEGLAELDSISGIFHLWGNTPLTSLKGLGQLQRLGDRLAVFNNANLSKLEGLDSLTYVGQDLRFEDNPLLSDISSLNHPITVKGALAIIGNSTLSNCAVESVCDYLAMPATFVAISGNGPNCQSVQEVETACLSSVWSMTDIQQTLRISPNPTTGLVRFLTEDTAFEIIRVMDITGRICDVDLKQNMTLDLSSVDPGIYWVEIGNQYGRAMTKVVKILK
ncbi:MAG: T9SS type A sorting domain-containing protein [Saprospiraceae bacterium]|nr:T9SS type A sorting domain-containing protein [Saprospiraceae bacterium]